MKNPKGLDMRVMLTFVIVLGSSFVIAEEPKHVIVYREAGRFGGWPANHGIWAWGDEILVGFSRGYYLDRGIYHHINKQMPEEFVLARSKDGGLTWVLEKPRPEGALIGTLAMRHGIMPKGTGEETPTDLKEPIDFTHHDLALTMRMENKDAGVSRLYYSYDRGNNWRGPYRMPLFGQPGVMARNDYIVNGPRDCHAILTCSKSNGKEGRVFAARTTDGGLTWKFLGFVGPEPVGYSIMPSTVRLSPTHLVCTIRCATELKGWIEAYASHDDGVTWEKLGTPEPDAGTGNPPSLLKVADGKLALVYGQRAEPYGIRTRFSSDEGKTWSEPKYLRDDGGGLDIGYVRSIIRPDNKVVSIYYYHDKSSVDRYIGATIWDPTNP